MSPPCTPLIPTRLLAALMVAFVAAPASASETARAKPPAARAAAAPAAIAAASAGSDAATADPLDHLRDRLAEKLGAVTPPSASPNVVRVVSKPSPHDPGDVVYSPGRVAHAASPARRSGALPAAGHAGAKAAPHWAYTGEVGPQAWGGLQPNFSTCANGKRQSPIDIRDGFAVDLEPPVFEYRASAFRVIDNGHTVQVNVDAGNSLLIRGRRYELQQFHFHRPSEERIEGRSFDMSAHLVHRDVDGHLAVVAVLLERGSAQPLVQTVWNHLPLEKHEEFAARVPIDLTQLVPDDRRYYTYMGSLTTPPCSEGVLWVVMRQPVGLSPEQIAIFSRLYPMNARPVQSAAGRIIKQSN
jgi:carbonic anhydrase